MRNLFLLLGRRIGRRHKSNGCNEGSDENMDIHVSILVPMPGTGVNGNDIVINTQAQSLFHGKACWDQRVRERIEVFFGFSAAWRSVGRSDDSKSRRCDLAAE